MKDPPSFRKRCLLHLTAIILIIWTGLFSFVYHVKLSIFRGDVALLILALLLLLAPAAYLSARYRAIGALVFAALICLFIDIQFGIFDWKYGRLAGIFFALLLLLYLLGHNLPTAVSAIFATMLVSTVIVSETGRSTAATTPAGQATAASEREGAPLPPVLYLILDEHMGLAGLERVGPQAGAVAAELRQFYVGNGFRVFERAYGRYNASINSIPAALNLQAGVEGEMRTRLEGSTATGIYDAAFFEAFARAGYRFSIHQTDYLDLCDPALPVLRCQTRGYDSLDALDLLDLTAVERAELILSVFLNRSFIYDSIRRSYIRLERWLEGRGLTVPRWIQKTGKIASVGAYGVLQDLTRQLSAGDVANTVFVGYVLLPHHPYVFDKDCKANRPVWAWQNNTDGRFGGSGGEPNSSATRAARYDLYLGQMQCLTRLLEGLFEGLRQRGVFDAMTIILHGDHGSRIYQVAPTADNLERLRPEDLRDVFSAHFAVKASGLPPGTDERPLPLDLLLRHARAPADLLVLAPPAIAVHAQKADGSFVVLSPGNFFDD